MSYELRSPLTNIIGFTHFLGDPNIGPLNPRQHEYLGYITSSTNALLAIVDNILDLATIEAGAMTLDLAPIDIRQTMEAAAEGVQDRLTQDQITLELQAEPDIGTFMADERRIRQALFNLLSNAVGFSPHGGTVVLAARRLARQLQRRYGTAEGFYAGGVVDRFRFSHSPPGCGRCRLLPRVETWRRR
jgi:signal transduction histidine kinase